MSADRFTIVCIAVAALGAGAAATSLLTEGRTPPRLEVPQSRVTEVDAAALATLIDRLAAPEIDAPVETMAQPRVSLNLIGVVRSDEGLLAVLSDGGRTYTVREGEAAAGHRVLALEADRVRLETPDGPATLRLAGG